MKHILITGQILTGNLFSENGYDEIASAKNLAELMRAKYRELAARDYPEAEIQIDIDIHRNASGCSRPLEITVTDDQDEEFVDFPDTQWYQHEIEQLEFDEWAVEAVEA